MAQATALSPLEIKRKLSNPAPPSFNTATLAPSSPAPEKPTTPAAAASISKHKRTASHSPATTDTEDESTSGLAPPPQGSNAPTSPRAPLAAISEAEDALVEGDSEDEEENEEEQWERRGMADLANAHRIKSGYLLKKGERRKAWKKRHFVLRPNNLAYYKNDKEYKLLRIIPLEDVHSVAGCDAKKNDFVFAIVTNDRTYYVKTKTKDDMDDWISKINAATGPTNGSGENGTKTSPVEGSLALTAVPPAQTTANEPQTTRSIAIPGTTAPTSTAPPSTSTTPGAHSIMTSPPTPFSPNILLSSSQTSQQSQLTSEATSPVGSPPPTAPPNSLATTGPLGLQFEAGRDTVSNLDVGLQRLSMADRSRDRRGSLSGNTSSGGEGPATSRSPRHREDIRAASPNVASSSEDEDYDPPDSPVTRGAPSLPAGGGEFTRALDPNRVIMQGYLMKQGKRKNWRKRWFQLVSEKLVYSRSHVDGKVHRQIPISKILDAIEYTSPSASNKTAQGSHGMTKDASAAGSVSGGEPETPGVVVGGLVGNKRYENCFKIITMKRTYLVCAPTEEEEVNWLSALQLLIASRRKQEQPGSATSPAPGSGISMPPASPARARPPASPSFSGQPASSVLAQSTSQTGTTSNQPAATGAASQPLQKHASSGTLNLPSIETLLTRTSSSATAREQPLEGAVRG